MSRHPTTSDARRTLAAILGQAPVEGTKPLSHRERAMRDVSLGYLQNGEQRESKPRVPLIGVDSGAIPGTRPDHLYGGSR